MSTENPIISNFIGLQGLQGALEKITLVVNDNGSVSVMSAEFDRNDNFDPASISRLGLTLNIGIDEPSLVAASEEARLQVEDIKLAVVAEDPFLKERDLIYFEDVSANLGEIKLYSRGGIRPRSMLNSSEGLRIEVYLVLGENIEILPGRPYREGTKLAGLKFRLTSYPEAGGITLHELTEIVRNDNGLSKKTQLFVEKSGELLGSSSLGEAITVYAESKLLHALRGARSGLEYSFIATGLAIHTTQQIAYMLSSELNADPSFVWGDEEQAVLSFIHQKLNEVTRVGKPKPSKDEAVRLLREEPQTVVALITALHDYAKDARNLLGGIDEGV